jgi:hypothetical protein
MMKKIKLVKAYTGTEITVMLLKSDLEHAGIASVIRNDFQSGITAGFGGGVPSAIDLYISESDHKIAAPVIEQFVRAGKKDSM